LRELNFNCLEHLLFAAYLVLFAWLVINIKFFTRSGLSSAQLIIIFLLKVMAGIFYGWIGVYYGELAQMVDTWVFHYSSLKEYEILMESPIAFFTSFFEYENSEGFTRFLTSKDSWWNDIKYLSFAKLLAIFNIFSFGNYYINIIFYSFLTLFGPIAIFRIMKEVFPKNVPALGFATFLLPSFIYWTSGLHKDGLIFAAIALIVYQIYHWPTDNKLTFKRLLIFFSCLFIILVLRGFLIGIMFPALLAWVLSAKLRFKPLLTIGLTYGMSILLFFTASFIHPKLNFPDAVAQRQREFADLHGGSAVEVSNLEPTVFGFIKNLPQALELSLLRPYFTDATHLLSLAAAVEIHIILLLLLLLLFFRHKDIRLTPFLYFSFSFALLLLLMTGYTVNFLGAIVRYRSLALPFFVIPIVGIINWHEIKRKILNVY